MQMVTTVAAVRAQVHAWRAAGQSIGFVPTMGNLHAGHLSLLAEARERADHVVASIFVNPLQFGPQEDFERYPRTLREDERLLAEARCELLFAPGAAEMYPDGEQPTRVHVRGLAEVLCGQFRPGHFDGVATVVAKLLGIVAPDLAVFGEKDYQQLLIIRRMAADLALPVRILGAPIVRAADGLALSSRNQYLSAAERSRAPRLYAALHRAGQAFLAGARDYAALEQTGLEALTQAGFRVDYFSVRDAAELAAPHAGSLELAVLAAAWLGRSRLIDNVRVAAVQTRLADAVAGEPAAGQ